MQYPKNFFANKFGGYATAKSGPHSPLAQLPHSPFSRLATISSMGKLDKSGNVRHNCQDATMRNGPEWCHGTEETERWRPRAGRVQFIVRTPEGREEIMKR